MTGNPEINLEGFEEVPGVSGFKAHRDGRILSHKGKLIGSQSANNGYIFVRIVVDGGSKTTGAHVLVAKTYCEGYKPGLCVHHKNNVRNDNRAENLMWVTHRQNIQLTPPHSNFSRSAKKKKAKLAEELRLEELKKAAGFGASIHKMPTITVTVINHLKTGATVALERMKYKIQQKELSKKMGVSDSYLSTLESGKRQWTRELFKKADEAIKEIRLEKQQNT